MALQHLWLMAVPDELLARVEASLAQHHREQSAQFQASLDDSHSKIARQVLDAVQALTQQIDSLRASLQDCERHRHETEAQQQALNKEFQTSIAGQTAISASIQAQLDALSSKLSSSSASGASTAMAEMGDRHDSWSWHARSSQSSWESGKQRRVGDAQERYSSAPGAHGYSRGFRVNVTCLQMPGRSRDEWRKCIGELVEKFLPSGTAWRTWQNNTFTHFTIVTFETLELAKMFQQKARATPPTLQVEQPGFSKVFTLEVYPYFGREQEAANFQLRAVKRWLLRKKPEIEAAHLLSTREQNMLWWHRAQMCCIRDGKLQRRRGWPADLDWDEMLTDVGSSQHGPSRG